MSHTIFHNQNLVTVHDSINSVRFSVAAVEAENAALFDAARVAGIGARRAGTDARAHWMHLP